MNNLIIESTKATPLINFDVNKGVLEFKGKSLPEDALKFYKTVDKTMEEFIKERNNGFFEIRCEFVYINTSSSKALYNLLKKAVDNFGNNVTINWNYEEDDEDMQEQGQDFADALGVNFNYKVFAA